jgi:hypothetical protein
VIVDVGNHIPISRAGIDWARRLPGDGADRADVIEMPVGHENRDASQPEVRERGDDAFRLFTGIDHHAVGRIVGVDDVAVCPVGPERE